MNGLISDSIDESDWLKKVFNPETGNMETPDHILPERRAKGDIKEFVDEETHARGEKSFAWLPDELCRRGFIELEHLNTAEVVTRLKDAAHRFTDQKKTLGLVKILSGGDSKGGLNAEDIYYGLIRGISKRRDDGRIDYIVYPVSNKQWKMIENVCFKWKDLSESEFCALYSLAPSIQNSFVEAQKVLAELFKLA